MEALGNLGDFIGGLAVVATLIYPAIQVRQNNLALHGASRQAVASGYRDCNRLLLNTRISLAFSKGLSTFPDMVYEERSLFAAYVVDQALFFQSVFSLYESGQLEESTYRAYLNWFASILVTPGGNVWWQKSGRPIFEESMVAAIDKRLSTGGLPDIRELDAIRLDEPVDA